jgi:hypothetical protein
MHRDRPTVALLIDYDNLEIGASYDLPGRPLDLGCLVELAQRYGTVIVARAYADWSDPNERLAVYEAGIEPCFAPVFRSGADQPGKSLADTVLVADGVDILWRVAPDYLVLVTSDKDILPLARLARLRGTRTIVVGSDRTALPLRRLADEYVTYRDLVRGTGVPVATHQRAGLVPLSRGAPAEARGPRLVTEARPAGEGRRAGEPRPQPAAVELRPGGEAAPSEGEGPVTRPAGEGGGTSRRRRRRRGGGRAQAAGEAMAAAAASAAPAPVESEPPAPVPAEPLAPVGEAPVATPPVEELPPPPPAESASPRLELVEASTEALEEEVELERTAAAEEARPAPASPRFSPLVPADFVEPLPPPAAAGEVSEPAALERPNGQETLATKPAPADAPVTATGEDGTLASGEAPGGRAAPRRRRRGRAAAGQRTGGAAARRPPEPGPADAG